MDVALVIRRRLRDLGLEQRDLAVAARVTESYISQLLARKKVPPAPNRTDLYPRIESFLKLPGGELSRLAEAQRQQELKKRVMAPPEPLFPKFRSLVLRKCIARSRVRVRAIVEKEPFGELERLVTQKLLDVARGVANDEKENQKWLRMVARLGKRSYEQIRVLIVEFLDTEVFSVSLEHGTFLLAYLVETWDIDLGTFSMEIVLNPGMGLGRLRRFEFVERQPEDFPVAEPGFDEFLRDKSLSGDTTEEEIEFLRRLKFNERRPLPIYYYRELQNLRDPVHFRHSVEMKRFESTRALRGVNEPVRAASISGPHKSPAK
jgi:transcriptional regulator with XRE-family HTH domain